SESLALEVAKELTNHDALEAHARDELGIHEMTAAKPLQAALASAASFIFGGALPVLIAVLGYPEKMVYLQYGFSVIFLAILGGIAANTGGSSVVKGIFRITFWGTVAMLVSALIGHLFGVNIV
ncbi:MAG TPA: VIT family protein, partial [Flavobacteriia bacterium]|nr:VIT family protein [Flavobacteriia bacterium]